MTSQERVLAALSHAEPDRVPVDLAGHRASGIAAMAYPKLRQALGLSPKPVYVYDAIQQLAIVDEDVLDRLGVDTIEMGRGFALEQTWWRDWILPDGTPCNIPSWMLPERYDGGWGLRSSTGNVLARMPDGAVYFDQVFWPFARNDDLDLLPQALAENVWTAMPSPPGPCAPDARAMAEGARRLRARTDRAILWQCGGSLLEMGNFMYGMDNFLVLLAGEPRRAHAFLDKITEFHLATLERYLPSVGPFIDIIRFGDDLGGQKHPLISPGMYREFFKPRHKLLWMRARQLADVKVMLHCCGSIRALLADLIEAGLDAINPVQISAGGMETAGLKWDFGRDITLWGGGCDTQSVLPRGAPEDVRRHVSEQMSTLAPDGRFVFQQVHNIQSNVPAGNIVAMFEAVAEFNTRKA